MFRPFQSYEFPGITGIVALPHAMAGGHIPPKGLFPFPYIYNVRIGFRYGYCTNGTSIISIGNALPGASGIFGFPDAASGGTHVVEVRIPDDAGCRSGPATPERPYQAPAYGIVQGFFKSRPFLFLRALGFNILAKER
jgi:hypothetical protein